VAVSRCLEAEHETGTLSEAKVNELIIEDSCFEDISSNAWSSALSVGHLVSVGSQSKSFPQEGQQLSRYKDLHEQVVQCVPLESFMSVMFSRCTVRRCSLGVVASAIKLQAQHNTLLDVRLAAWQLCDVVADLQGNIVDHCVGTAFSLHAMTNQRNAFCRLYANTYRGCNVGIRLSAVSGVPCKVEARDELLDSNGDGVILLSPQCHAKFVSCTLKGSRRCGARVGRGARGSFERCNVSLNGRGVVAAAASSVEVQNCSFDNNVGWAVRLEDASSMSVGSASVPSSPCSVVSGNVFGSAQQGNVGRKRVRIDGWEDGRVLTLDNIDQDQSSVVVPFLKRRRNFDAEAEAITVRLCGMSLDP
jgi:hypothetical protein